MVNQHMRRVVNTHTPAVRKAILDMTPKNLVLSHGTAIHGTFIVPRGTSFVFLSEPGKELSQSVVDKYFYELFSSMSIESIPKDWVSRTYLPGSECPNLFLDPRNGMWPGMGLHRLPLRGFLAAHPTGPHDTIKDPEKLAASLRNHNPAFRNTVERGPAVNLLSSIGANTGVVFVVACRGSAPVPVPSLTTMREASRERILRAKRGLHKISGEGLSKEQQERLLLREQRRKLRAEAVRGRKPMNINERRGQKRKSSDSNSGISNVEELVERMNINGEETHRQKSLIMGLVLDQRKKRRKLSR